MPESLIPNWLVRPLAALSAATANTSGGLPVVVANVNVSQSVTSPSTGTGTVPATRIGINLDPARFFEPNRAFMNLLAGHFWIISGTGVSPTPTAEQLDAQGNLVSLASGTYAQRLLNVTPAMYRTGSADIVCRWKGTGTFDVTGTSVANARRGDHKITFTYTYSGKLNNAVLKMLSVSATDPVHDLDCRETNADPNTLFDPDYVKRLSGFDTLRYLEWMNYSLNAPATWATRTTTDSPNMYGRDGYAIEYMIALANATHTNAWFTLPWNADADYYRHFAELVREQLDPSLKAYVETSNEVWNGIYAIHDQALAEGQAENLSSSNEAFTGLLRRYAEKMTEINKIWTDVFQGQESRIVRVAGVQAGQSSHVGIILGFRDTADYVDAIAQAPYFDAKLDGNYTDTPTSIAKLFTDLRARIDLRVAEAQKVKASATFYGKSFICYESGQHVTGTDLALANKVQRDPRMGQLYAYYLSQWQQKLGGLMNHYKDVWETSQYGSWGLNDFNGQAVNDSPKAKALYLFMRSIGQ